MQHFILISALQLSVSHDGNQCDDTSGQSVCAVIAPYDRHLTLTCTSDSPGKTLEWCVFHCGLFSFSNKNIVWFNFQAFRSYFEKCSK